MTPDKKVPPLDGEATKNRLNGGILEKPREGRACSSNNQSFDDEDIANGTRFADCRVIIIAAAPIQSLIPLEYIDDVVHSLVVASQFGRSLKVRLWHGDELSQRLEEVGPATTPLSIVLHRHEELKLVGRSHSTEDPLPIVAALARPDIVGQL